MLASAPCVPVDALLLFDGDSRGVLLPDAEGAALLLLELLSVAVAFGATRLIAMVLYQKRMRKMHEPMSVYSMHIIGGVILTYLMAVRS